MHSKVLLILAAAIALPAGPAGPVAPGGSQAAVLPAAVVEALAGVVSVRVREKVEVPAFRGGRFVKEPVEGVGAGSGVIVSDDGLILTNAHVVAGSAAISVTFASGHEASARLLAVDEDSDLALLRVPGAGFRSIRFADAVPAPGTEAFVVGNREDLGPEVARARIGAHRKVRVGARPLEFWAEVDARVGPGNSGGAVLDAEGSLLGIPSLLIIYSEDDGARPDARSAGLFIPAAHARRALQKMLAEPRTGWPWIGVLLEDALLASSEGRPWREADGPRVRTVFPGSPAQAAGFRRGDRIRAVGSQRTRDNFEALDATLDLPVGGSVTVAIERDGTLLGLKVLIATRPSDPRPEPLDDFALHTGLNLEARSEDRGGRAALAFASMTAGARTEMQIFEADMFAERPVLTSMLPGRDALAGASKRALITSLDDLASLLKRCFVQEQFVALAHWSLGGRTLDRAHVHRKVYPVVL
jgi:S1-C subfamily serine protease